MRNLSIGTSQVALRQKLTNVIKIFFYLCKSSLSTLSSRSIFDITFKCGISKVIITESAARTPAKNFGVSTKN